jgi:hypothetical protein
MRFATTSAAASAPASTTALTPRVLNAVHSSCGRDLAFSGQHTAMAEIARKPSNPNGPRGVMKATRSSPNSSQSSSKLRSPSIMMSSWRECSGKVPCAPLSSTTPKGVLP